VGRLSLTRDVDARGVHTGARSRGPDGAQDHEATAHGRLGVVGVGVARAEEGHELLGLAEHQRAAVALDGERGLVRRRVGLALGGAAAIAQGDDEAGDLAPLPELGRAVDVEEARVGLAAHGRRRRRALFEVRDVRGELGVEGGLEDRLLGLAWAAEGHEEIGQVVRPEALPLGVEEREQGLVHAARVLVAIVARAAHGLAHDRRELGRDVGPEELDGRVLAHLHAAERLERRGAAEGVHPGDALVEEAAEREEVAPRVDVFAGGLLGAHVGEFALELPRACVLDARGLERTTGLGDAEVGDLDLALVGEEHVLRRHVAVHDAQGDVVLVAAAVGVVEPLRHLARDVHARLEREGEGEPARAREERGHVEPVHELHRHEVRARVAGAGLRDAEVEHLDDVRVREAHGELRLVDEHVDEERALGELGQDALDDDDLLEALDAEALRLEDLGHAALAEPLEQPVAPERSSLGGFVVGARAHGRGSKGTTLPRTLARERT
jgi:hypothetical protein